jgi:TonB-linked SusC/RagA family outer membrane protein
MKHKIILSITSLAVLIILLCNQGYAGVAMVAGTVKDLSGNPVDNAIVTIYGQSDIFVTTDTHGYFSIEASEGQYLEAAHAGWRSSAVKVTGDMVTITLDKPDDVVELGFGMQRSGSELTAAIGVVSADDLSKSSVFNPANALFGKIPGLSVLQNGGAPWETDPSMYIRGVATYRNASVLVLVDGFERPVSSLSLSEIESVSVLKDAAALALYGQRGANGVILVTTKRGYGKELNVDYSYERGVTQAFRMPEFLDAAGYARAVNEALGNDNLGPLYSPQEIANFENGGMPYLYPNVNWTNEVFDDFGSTDNFNASFYGKTESVKYFSMINYQNEKGLLRPVDMNEGYSTQINYGKFNFRTNADVKVSKTTMLTMNMAGNLGEAKRPGRTPSAIMGSIFSTPSAQFPVKTLDNIWGGISTNVNNPAALVAATGHSLTHTRELFADMRIRQDLNMILDGLSAEAAIAYDNSANYLDNNTRQFQVKQLIPVKDPVTGELIDQLESIYGTDTELSFGSSLTNQWRNTSLWGKVMHHAQWGDQTLNTTLIYSQNKYVGNGQFSTYVHQTMAANAHYSLAGKYFADFTLSYGGSNILPKNNRYGVYPALSVAWRLSEENFMQTSSFVDNLRIRASWGMTGNNLVPQNIEEQRWMMSGNNYYFTVNNAGAIGFLEGRMASPNVMAETAYKSNLGVDAGLFGILFLNMDLFYEVRKNIFVDASNQYSGVLGVNAPLESSGIVNNKGVDLGFQFRAQKSDFSYNIGGQFSFARNEIVEMGEVFRPYDYLRRTGNAIGQRYGLEAIGFFSSEQDIANSPQQLFSDVRPGDIKYKDQNNDGIIDQFDEVALGYSSAYPEMYFSGVLAFEYMGVGLHALFQGLTNRTIYLNTRSLFWPLRGDNTISTYSDDRWTPATATTATLPRLSMEENENNYQTNSVWLTDGSFFKLRSLELYYDLPAQYISWAKLSNTRLYARGMNLFSWDQLKIADPEEFRVVYPTLTSFHLGVQVGL